MGAIAPLQGFAWINKTYSIKRRLPPPHTQIFRPSFGSVDTGQLFLPKRNHEFQSLLKCGRSGSQMIFYFHISFLIMRKVKLIVCRLISSSNHMTSLALRHRILLHSAVCCACGAAHMCGVAHNTDRTRQDSQDTIACVARLARCRSIAQVRRN